MQKGDPGLSIGTEISAETEVDACKDAVPDIAVQILASKADHICIIGKQADGTLPCKLHEDGDQNSIGYSNDGGAGQSLTCPFVLSGTDILGAQGRNSLRQHRLSPGGLL